MMSGPLWATHHDESHSRCNKSLERWKSLLSPSHFRGLYQDGWLYDLMKHSMTEWHHVAPGTGVLHTTTGAPANCLSHIFNLFQTSRRKPIPWRILITEHYYIIYKGFGCSLVFLPTDMIQYAADSHWLQSENRSSEHSTGLCYKTDKAIYRNIYFRNICIDKPQKSIFWESIYIVNRLWTIISVSVCPVKVQECI